MSDATDNFAHRSLRQKIGGRWAISLPAYVITAILGSIALISGESSATSSWIGITRWFALAALAAVAIGLFNMILHATVMRNRRTDPVAVWKVLVMNAACGVLFGFIVGVGAGQWGLQTDLTVVERVVLDVLYATWWGPTLIYFLDYREQSRKQRDELIAFTIETELIRIDQAELVDRLRLELHREVIDELSPATRLVESHLTEASNEIRQSVASSPSNWREISDHLRGAAEISIRQLSQRLWTEQFHRYPKTPWWTLPANIVRHQPFRPFMFSLVDILGTALVQIRLFGLQRGLSLTILVVLLIFAVMVPANALMQIYPKRHAPIFVAGIFVLQISLSVRAQFREFWIPGSASVTWQISQFLVGILVVMVTSGFGARSAKQTELRANFAETLQHDQITSIAMNRRIGSLTREAAQLLHGNVQTRLIACSMAIDQAGARGDQPGITAALREALAVLAEPLPQRPTSGTLADEVTRKVALWDGLCEFNVNVHPQVGRITGADVFKVGRVVEEAISNSIRHGSASAIDIDLTPIEPHSLQVSVSDDGCGPTSGVPGIGSALIQQATAGNWSLSKNPKGAHLRALINLA